MNVGIVGYGTYIPRYRLKISDIASVWGKQERDISRSLGVNEKVVPGKDEDAVTMAIESASCAITSSSISAEDIGVCFVGSESHPYVVNPTSTIVSEFLGVKHAHLALDLEFACKAATSGIIAAAGLVESGHVSYGLVIGSDTAQAAPHDVLEYTSAAAAVSLVLGPTSKHAVATITHACTYSSDTPDFWRRDGMRYPSHGGRFTGEPAYFSHVVGAASLLFEQAGISASSCTYGVFHSPNGKFPLQVAKRLGFSDDQVLPGHLVPEIGNPYSASALLGLCAVLDVAHPGDTICLISYGSGAGSDAFFIEVGEGVTTHRPSQSVRSKIKEKAYISYVEYLTHTHKI